MLRVFLYEFLTAGGCWCLGREPPTGSLLAEGRAMRDALARDFAAGPEIAEVQLMHDVRLRPPDLEKLDLHAVRTADEELGLFERLAAAADVTIVIVPEVSGLLFERVLLAERVRARLMSPGSELVRLAADKTATAELLAAGGICIPRGIRLPKEIPKLLDIDFPAILKPNDGAGSGHVLRVNDREELIRADLRPAASWRLERFVLGTPASVAVLAGPRGFLPLQPCFQKLSDDGRFTYLGGSTPLPGALAQRAKRLALQVVHTLPNPRGYLGIDMVLGSAENGTEDFVIEINPRLTTSYLGLRLACEQNLAEAMLKYVRGEAVSLTYRSQKIEFAPAALPATS